MIYRKQLYVNQTSWKKVNKMRNFTVIADLNGVQKSSMVTIFPLLILFEYMSAL